MVGPCVSYQLTTSKHSLTKLQQPEMSITGVNNILAYIHLTAVPCNILQKYCNITH